MTTRAPLDGFETALLAELREHVVSRRPVPAPARRRRRLTAAVAALGTAVAAIAGALVLRPDPAFAVDTQSDGDVVVTITSLKDADGLEAALREQGVEAEVDYSAEPLVPPPAGAGSTGEQSLERETDGSGGQSTHREGTPGGPDGGCATQDDDGEQAQSTVSVEQTGDGITFTLSNDFVDSDAQISITTSGQDDGPGAISVQMIRECAPGSGGSTRID